MAQDKIKRNRDRVENTDEARKERVAQYLAANGQVAANNAIIASDKERQKFNRIFGK